MPQSERGQNLQTERAQEGAGKISLARHSASIYGRGFLKHFGIEHSKTRRYAIRLDEKTGMLILEAE